MHFQMQQLQQRLNQLQRELSSISNQLSSLSSQSFSGGLGGGYGLGQGQGGMGSYSFGGGLSGISGQLGNIVSYTPAHSPKAGVGDGQQQSFGVSDYNYPVTSYFSGHQGGQVYGGMGSGMSGGMSGFGMGGQQSNIVSYTAPSATAGFSEVNSSPTGRQDYGVGGSNQAFRLGQY